MDAARRPAPLAARRRSQPRAARARLRQREPSRPRSRGACAAPRSSSTSTITTTTRVSARSTSSSRTRRRPARSFATSCDELDVELTPEIAEALYIALVTDTGRFQYTNTTPKALRLAAELVEAGADVHKIFQDVYESVQFAKLKLLARALERAEIYEGGRLVISYLLRGDFAEVGRRGAVLGGDHRLPARRRGCGHGGADPRASARRRTRAARSACAHRRTSSTCRRSRAPQGPGVGTGRPRVSRATTRSRRSRSSSAASSPRLAMAS